MTAKICIDRAEFMRLYYDNKISVNSIAAHFGVSKGYISKLARAFGVKTRREAGLTTRSEGGVQYGITKERFAEALNSSKNIDEMSGKLNCGRQYIHSLAKKFGFSQNQMLRASPRSNSPRLHGDRNRAAEPGYTICLNCPLSQVYCDHDINAQKKYESEPVCLLDFAVWHGFSAPDLRRLEPAAAAILDADAPESARLYREFIRREKSKLSKSSLSGHVCAKGAL